MAQVRFENSQLVVEPGNTDSLFSWEHTTFFTMAAGYRLDRRQSYYVYTDQSDIQRVLRDTVEYLDTNHIPFETDSYVEAQIRAIRTQETEYQEALNKGATYATNDVPTLPDFIRPLKSYQLRSVQHLLAVKHGANFSVPGSGKTTVIYAVYAYLKAQSTVDTLLVIGPRSCFQPWEEEYEACFGVIPKVARLTGSRGNRQEIYENATHYELLIGTYNIASNDTEYLINLCNKQRVFVVIDESHNIKKIDDGVWSEAIINIAPYATRRAVLSGTPMPNSYLDLWTQMTYLYPGKQVLGEREAYKQVVEDNNRRKEIRQIVKPFFTRTTKTELNLPTPIFNRVLCQLTPYQASIYRALAVRFLRELAYPPEDVAVLRQWRKAKMVRLIQAASNPTLLAQYSEEFNVPPISGEGASVIQLIDQYPEYEIPAKVTQAVSTIKTLLSQGEKVVLWTSFVHNIRMLQHLLADYPNYTLYGAIPQDESENAELNREQQLREFKFGTDASVLIANPAACAESISLHKICHHAVYLDRTFNCGQYMQSLDRIHRIGLNLGQSVTYHILVAEGTIDETINIRLNEKQATMMQLLGDDIPVGQFESEKYQLGQTSDEELIDFQRTIADLERQSYITEE